MYIIRAITQKNLNEFNSVKTHCPSIDKLPASSIICGIILVSSLNSFTLMMQHSRSTFDSAHCLSEELNLVIAQNEIIDKSL